MPRRMVKTCASGGGEGQVDRPAPGEGKTTRTPPEADQLEKQAPVSGDDRGCIVERPVRTEPPPPPPPRSRPKTRSSSLPKAAQPKPSASSTPVASPPPTPPKGTLTTHKAFALRRSASSTQVSLISIFLATLRVPILALRSFIYFLSALGLPAFFANVLSLVLLSFASAYIVYYVACAAWSGVILTASVPFAVARTGLKAGVSHAVGLGSAAATLPCRLLPIWPCPTPANWSGVWSLSGLSWTSSESSKRPGLSPLDLHAAAYATHRELGHTSSVVRTVTALSSGPGDLITDASSLESLAAAVRYLSTNFDDPAAVSNSLDDLGASTRTLGKSLIRLVVASKNTMREQVRLYDQLRLRFERAREKKSYTEEDVLKYRDFVSEEVLRDLKQLQAGASMAYSLASDVEDRARKLKNTATRQLRLSQDAIDNPPPLQLPDGSSALAPSTFLSWLPSSLSIHAAVSRSQRKRLIADLELASAVLDRAKRAADDIGLLSVGLDGYIEALAQASKEHVQVLHSGLKVEDLLDIMEESLSETREVMRSW